jgi:hypothetical protein
MAYTLKQHKQKFEKVPMFVVKAKNYEAGQHWFSKDTMRFFNSKVPDEALKKGDNAFFISQEDDFDRSGKVYTIRKANLKTGEVDTIGDFGVITSKSEAEKKMLEEMEKN